MTFSVLNIEGYLHRETTNVWDLKVSGLRTAFAYLPPPGDTAQKLIRGTARKVIHPGKGYTGSSLFPPNQKE
jgi:hypothetical protein